MVAGWRTSLANGVFDKVVMARVLLGPTVHE